MAVKSYADYAREQLGVQDGAKQSQYQKQKNRVSYQKYVNNYLAEQQKNEQLAQIEKNKNTALSESAIASERARKYVDAVNKHLGIAGTGYGESKAIDLYAQEAKRRAEINNAHSEQENEALKAYKQAIANAALAENEAMGNIELAEDEANEAKRQAYVAKLQELNDNPEITKEDFSRYYKEYAQYLGDDDKLLKEDLEAKNAKIEAEKEITSSLHSEPEKTISLNELVANEDALGKFTKGTEQTEWINEIISRAQSNGADSLEGKVIDANFGWGSQYYLYKNGYFYKVTKAQAEANGWEIIRKNKETNINLGM